MDAGTRADRPLTAEEFVSRVAQGPWPGFRIGERLDPAADIFLLGFHADATEDELGDLAVDDLAQVAYDFWLWRGERGHQEQAVRIRPGVGAGGRDLGRDILEVAGPDMPFLVDSVMGEIADQSIAPLAMFHPIAPAASGQGRDSLIQVHMPPLTPARAAALQDGVRATLADVRASVADFAAMKRNMLDRANELSRARSNAPAEEAAEGVALLRWLAADRFTFLGARDYQYSRDEAGRLLPDEPVILESTGLGVLRDPERYVLRSTAEPFLLTPKLQRLIEEPTPIIVSKSTMRSRVHRRTDADYIGVKRYGADGEVIGETRFVGLFGSDAFTEPTREIPVLRRKVEWIMAEAGFAPGGHSYKTLGHILESYPRDEFWQSSREELFRNARGILHLLDRPRPRVFTRRDRFNRFVSALAFLPKERFNSTLRKAVGKRLEEAYGGRVESFFPNLGEGPLARVHFVIADIDKTRPDPDPRQLDADVAALTRTWEDAFVSALRESELFDAQARQDVERRFQAAFTAAYRERYGVSEALIDAAQIVAAREDESIRVRAYQNDGDAESTLRCKFYARGDVLALSATVPILENLGLFVESEQNYKLHVGARDEHEATQTVYVHDLEMRSADNAPADLARCGRHFEEAFIAIWNGAAENDGFNRLILKLGASWREAALVRALARFRQQTGLDPSQAVQEAALSAHPDIAAQILALFRVRFDPNLPETLDARRDWAAQIAQKIEAALAKVESLDEDRVLRRISALVGAILRTNYYQRAGDGGAKPYISFKIESGALAELPAPKPYREIWVASAQVEGVHLRMGPVARGGLRWTDRRDDFRTEILDLVKAQQVKNAIIVPVGAKGGFFPKRLPARDAANYRDVAVEAYKTFLRGLLDITDNLQGESVIAPEGVVRWDGEDPYLVVAADKGTATFSDIANGVSAEYGFWLGDAFASGGSVGYDHKAMGITAKGAWVAVQRHFREIGKNIQEAPFSVIGVGDMSGDVFGNGMLLSKKIKLVAAFDHRHIFIDPNPADLDAAWDERKRLFDKPRSSWADYDAKLISKGGGVFARTQKSIALSEEMMALTGLKAASVTPAELISALLKAPCELLWFGGIGTYIKARAESHADVGDKTNDALRVDAEDLRAQVVGEGANLAVTQKARIAFARRGGRINSDAVDNSAGVDTSDHEVNIKILLTDAIHSGALKAKQREKLLAAMTDDVGRLVLMDNYDQTLALSVSQASAAADLDSHERFMLRLEAAGKLSRTVEGLPSSDEVAALRAGGFGLTRPELAKLIAYAKIDLFDAFTTSDGPNDPAFVAPLAAYFPPQLAEYRKEMARHRLRADIIATKLADEVINRCGPSFVDRVREIARVDAVTVASAFAAVDRIYDFRALVERINALDNKAPAAAQIALHQEIATAFRRLCVHLARHGGFDRTPKPTIDSVVGLYRDAVQQQRSSLWEDLSQGDHARAEARKQHFQSLGAPDDLASDAALLLPLSAALDIADLSRSQSWPVPPAAHLYRAVGAAFGLDTLRGAAQGLTLEQHWDRLVVRRAAEDLYEDQRVLAAAAASAIGAPPAGADVHWGAEAARDWIAGLGAPAQTARAAFAELEGQGQWTFAKVMLAAAEIHGLANALR
ncbi:MAG TPA: NAD-glutamate dehydrogenase [Caulobacterales bacterium]|nr:NAD-glutamate dehydrogenase [Caulobacterales bacterium]